MPSDWYFTSASARDFVERLAPDMRQVWDRVMADLLEDPWPDELRKVTLPAPPFPAGLFGQWAGPFWIAYRVPNPEVVEVTNVAWSPESPNFNRPAMM